MLRSRGSSHLFRTVISAIIWPARPKRAPFFALDMEQIPAFREKDRATSTFHHWAVGENDPSTWSTLYRVPFADFNDHPLLHLAQDHPSEAKSAKDTSVNLETLPLAAHLKALAERDALEEAIRREADPKGVYSRGTIDTAGLVKNVRKRHRDAVEDHRREKAAMEMERKDLEHKHDDEKERLRSIIRGQKEAIHLADEGRQRIADENCALQLKKTTKEELAAKDRENEELRTHNHEQERVIRDLEAAAKVNGDVFKKTVVLMSETQQALREAERTMKSHQGQVRTLTRWDKDSSVKDEECVALKSQINSLKAGQRMEQIKAKARNENLQTRNETLQEANDNMKKELESWKIGQHGNLRVFEPTHQHAQPKDEARTLANKLKAATTRGDALQKNVDALQKENDTFQTRLQFLTDAHDPQTQEEMKRLRSDNVALRESKRKADDLKSPLQAQSADAEQKLQELQVLKNTHDQGIQVEMEHLRSDNLALREAEKKADDLEGQMQAQSADAKQKLQERLDEQSRALHACFAKKLAKVQELDRKEDALESRQGALATQQRDLQKNFEEICEQENDLRSREEDLATREKACQVAYDEICEQMNAEKSREEDLATREKACQVAYDEICQQINDEKSREEDLATREKACQVAYDEICQQINAEKSREEDLVTRGSTLSSSQLIQTQMEARAEEAEREVLRLKAAASDYQILRNLVETNMGNEIESQRRDGQRHLELLNEETRMAAEDYRLQTLHQELQTANCSISSFKYDLINIETGSEALIQGLYGADFSESDVLFLQEQGRPVLLAQLQAAKRTLNSLRCFLAGNPNIEIEKALSIVMEPRGDENAAPAAEDIFAQSNEDQQPAHQSTSRKRSAAPLCKPAYGDHEDNTVSNDWEGQDQGVSPSARLSTPDEILNRHKCLPKSRRNEGRTQSVS